MESTTHNDKLDHDGIESNRYQSRYKTLDVMNEALMNSFLVLLFCFYFIPSYL